MGSEEQLRLDHLSKHERHALSLVAIRHLAGQASEVINVERVFATPKEARVRLGCMVALGFLKKGRGGFRPSEAALREMGRVADEEKRRQEGLFGSMGKFQRQHPTSFLALRGGELADHDPDLGRLLARTGAIPSAELSIVPPLQA
jgi:hypothetical protein